MSLLAQIKQPLKMLRWRLRRFQAAGHWGGDDLSRSPIVIGNAMPKSGSHLLIQVLLGLTKIGPFVDPGMPPITRSSTNQNLGQPEILESLHHLLPGDVVYCYLHAQEQYIAELTRPGVAAYFIY